MHFEIQAARNVTFGVTRHDEHMMQLMAQNLHAATRDTLYPEMLNTLFKKNTHTHTHTHTLTNDGECSSDHALQNMLSQ